MHELLGWAGSPLFATCAVPHVIKTWQSKKADDRSWLFLIFWLAGEALSLAYIIIDDLLIQTTHFPLYVNYVFNFVLVLYLVYVKKYY